MTFAAFHRAVTERLLREPTPNETANIAVIALGLVTDARRPLTDTEWRAVIGTVMGNDALPSKPLPGVKVAGVDFSSLNAILVSVAPGSKK